MQGIEILNKEPVMIQDERLCIAVMVVLSIAFISACVAMKIDNEVLGNGLVSVFIVCVVLALGIAIAYKTVEIPSDRYQYEVTIDENVSIQEVYEKYNVIEQDGKKWILEDKECAE